MKKIVKISVVILLVLLFLGPVKDVLIKSAVVAGAKAAAGVDVKIDQFSLSLLQQSVKITGLKVYNPAGFPQDTAMVDIPEIAVKVDVPSIFKNVLHLPYMRLDLKEARVIINKAGAMNVNSLKFAQPAQSDKKEPQPPQGGKKSPAQEMKMRLDLVVLNIGTIYIEDYRSGKEKPKLTILKVNIRNSEFKDVTSPTQLGSLVMFQTLAPAGLDDAFSLGSKLFGETSGNLGSVVHSIGNLFKGF
ncbi:MAG: hypothetical protein HQL17_05380 [Candidatus Omnitrophica bacterium]|nr:hypothetical protein [Candidatus Omnitrophota bacterium]